MPIWAHAIALTSLAFITANLLVWVVPVLSLGLVKWAAPPWRSAADNGLEWVYRTATRIDDAWLKGVVGLQWEAVGVDLHPTENVIVVSNHVSWADILLIQSVVALDGPILKFLAKRELIYVPIFGAIFWAFDFPILRRRSKPNEDEAERRRQDFEAIHDACAVVARRPSALVNFAEGTRFSLEKRDRRASPYDSLLEPRVGGFSALLDALSEHGVRVLDLTLKYPEDHSFWRFLAGRSARIEIEGKLFEPAQLPKDRDARRLWLANRWAYKERAIQQFRGERRSA